MGGRVPSAGAWPFFRSWKTSWQEASEASVGNEASGIPESIYYCNMSFEESTCIKESGSACTYIYIYVCVQYTEYILARNSLQKVSHFKLALASAREIPPTQVAPSTVVSASPRPTRDCRVGGRKGRSGHPPAPPVQKRDRNWFR